MTLTQISFAMLAAGAGGGLLFTLFIVRKKRYPRLLAAGHGLLGLLALAVLGYALTRSPTPIPQIGWWAAAALSAAWGGGALFFRILRPQVPRLWLALMHGSLASLGLFLLYQLIA